MTVPVLILVMGLLDSTRVYRLSRAVAVDINVMDYVEAARALLAEAGQVGRKFDFLTQEFMREANTLCSKSQSLGLTRIGLDLKTVIDQMREQVQNVE